MRDPDPTHYRVLCGQSEAQIVADIRAQTGWDFTLQDLYAQNPDLGQRFPQACEELKIAPPLSRHNATGGGGIPDDNDPDPEWLKTLENNPVSNHPSADDPAIYILNGDQPCDCI